MSLQMSVKYCAIVSSGVAETLFRRLNKIISWKQQLTVSADPFMSNFQLSSKETFLSRRVTLCNAAASAAQIYNAKYPEVLNTSVKLDD